MVAKHLVIDVDEATEPSALRTINVAQKAKDVLVEPVLLLIYKVNGFVTVAPGVQVSQGVVGSVALTNLKSPDVHELAAGKVGVCANDSVDKKIKEIKQQALNK